MAEAKQKLFNLLVQGNSNVVISDDNSDEGLEDGVGESEAEEIGTTYVESESNEPIVSQNFVEGSAPVNMADLHTDVVHLKENFEKIKSVMDVLLSKTNMQILEDNGSTTNDDVSKLRNQVEEVLSINSELRRKIDDLENEKKSLLTVIRLLRGDQETDTNSVH